LILNGKELTFEEKLKIVNDLYNSGINSIDFSGGNLLLIDDNIKITPICYFYIFKRLFIYKYPRE
jgi:hypothetical protein